MKNSNRLLWWSPKGMAVTCKRTSCVLFLTLHHSASIEKDQRMSAKDQRIFSLSLSLGLGRPLTRTCLAVTFIRRFYSPLEVHSHSLGESKSETCPPLSGRSRISRRGRKPTIWPIFPKNYMKMKKVLPRRERKGSATATGEVVCNFLHRYLGLYSICLEI